MLIQRFLEKGYKKQELLKVRDKVGKINRADLLSNKLRGNEKIDLAFITGFNI